MDIEKVNNVSDFLTQAETLACLWSVWYKLKNAKHISREYDNIWHKQKELNQNDK